MKLDVRLNVQSMLALRSDSEKQVRKAASYSLNRAIDTGRTAGARGVSQATKIKTRDVAKRMTIRGANPDRLIATLEAHPYSPNLAKFRATENSKGVAASAWEGRKTYKHAFINPKTQRVVARQTNARLPLKGLKGPSVRKTFMREEIQRQVSAAAEQRFITDFERDITRRLGK